MSRTMSAVLAGVVAGLVGAGIWAAIAYFAHFESAWVAWGIGGLVGFAVAMGAQEETGAATGVIAVVITVIAIAGGKWVAINFEVQKSVEEYFGDIEITEQDCIVRIADETYEVWQESGRSVTWPAGESIETADEERDYPADLWRVAQQEWDDMGPDRQEDFLADRQAEFDVAVDQFADTVKSQAFKGSFGLLDIVFFGLAMFTAFKLGAGVHSE